MSTHYVNPPHCINLKDKQYMQKDEQHYKMSWFDLVDVISQKNKLYEYLRKLVFKKRIIINQRAGPTDFEAIKQSVDRTQALFESK